MTRVEAPDASFTKKNSDEELAWVTVAVKENKAGEVGVPSMYSVSSAAERRTFSALARQAGANSEHRMNFRTTLMKTQV